MSASAFRLLCRDRVLEVAPGRAHVVGVLNVTPDSFSDGGRFLDPGAALAHAETLLAEGAAVIEVGGESTRPRGAAYGAGAAPVPAAEELRRVLPVVEALVTRLPEALVAVDTYKAEVAEAALEAGAHLVNDVTGLRDGDALARVAARHGAALVVMHARGRPGAMPHEVESPGDVLEEVVASLRASVAAAARAGVRSVVVDPGFGFGKTPRENLRLVAGTDRLRAALGRPVMVGVSRKATLGVVLGTPEAPAPVHERLFGGLGAAALAVVRGASLVRTHDVRPTVELLRVLTAALEAGADLAPVPAAEAP